MRPRENQVEKLFESTLNRLLNPQGYAITLGPFSNGSCTIPLFLKNEYRTRGIGAIWPEWSDTYVVCIGERRGLYLSWKLSEKGVELSLNTETTDPKDFHSEETLPHSKMFIDLSETILQEFRK